MIDIIIPIYNSRTTLPLLLGSLVMQTYKDKHIILIDDCSVEKYEDILISFKNLLDIEYIKLSKNYGSGYARNIGIDKSNGDYICFADSDDTFLNAFALEKMVADIENSNYDFSSYGFVQQCKELTFSNIQCNATWVFGKMYRRSFLNKFHIRFNEERYNEDVYFNQVCYSLSDNIYKANDTLYLHHINKNSVTKTHDYEVDDMESFIKSYITAYLFVLSKIELTDKIKWQYLDGLLIMYNFYTEKIRIKSSEYCERMYKMIVEYYILIFDFAKDFICSDEFVEHYNRIYSTHGIHNKQLISTLDWYTFINKCELSRRKILNLTNKDFK